TLIISSLKANDAGIYTCTASTSADTPAVFKLGRRQTLV
uniref:Papilin, proteoglycan like sulfated glycoprotein n=1 Tax=Tetraodon nigroviridis TaxID=99883 RepID=H3C6X1_TETNG